MLNVGLVGHTHEDVDLLWAVVMARILNQFSIQTSDEFADAIRVACPISAVPKVKYARQSSWKE